MWRFIDLSEEQKLQRREYLDWAGYIAQASVLIPLLVIQIFAIASWTRKQLSSKNGIPSTPSSPYVKYQRLGHKISIQGLAARWRIFYWWCGSSVDVAGVHLGTRGEVLAAGVWTVWLLVLSVVFTGDDYMHLTKRFGIVGASQLPFHYLLSLKSPYSPLQFLTRRSHESLIAIHQLLGRIITFLFYLHAAFYVYFFVDKGLLAAKLTQFYIICGVFAVVAFTAVGTTALKPVRDWSYRVFYITHVALATILLPVLYFHVHHIRLYIWETLAVYVVNLALRYFATKTHTGSVKVISNADLVEIDVPLHRGVASWQPGQHAYISLAGNSLLRTFKSNPFTVAAIPAIDGKLRFVARILDGNTAKLAKTAEVAQKVSVEGPYGVATHPEALLGYDRVLCVAGGIGATFVVPLYRQLLSDLSPSKGSHRRQKVSFVWVARSMADVSWALPEDPKERDGFTERLRVYLTNDVNGATSGADADFAIGTDDDDQAPGGDGIELEEQKKLLTEEASGEKEASGLVVQAGRPNLSRAVEQMFTQSSTEKIAVVVCGPRSLSLSLRNEVGRWVNRGRECLWWAEEFGL